MIQKNIKTCHAMTQQEFIQRRDSYKNITAIVALLAIVAIPFGICFAIQYTSGGQLLSLFSGCVLLPLIGYVMFARYLAKQMGLVCSSCGRRILFSSPGDLAAGKCKHCGGVCVADQPKD
jgi:hypothetical protein